jgi:predicted Ser/Thr protein kinase
MHERGHAAAATPCAGNNTVATLLAGGLDAEAALRLEQHLDACATCRQIVAELGRGLSAIGAAPGAPAGGADLPQVGERVGRHEIRRVVGVGGMGVVYEAHDRTLDRRVALKLLRPDLVAADGVDLLAEAQAMARLAHAHIAVVHDVGLHAGQVYVCMEYVDGRTLRAWLEERPRAWPEILRVFAAAGQGLAYVHRAGLVHLDFKPDNVLIGRDDRVKVTDFGLARMASARARGPRAIMGTWAYMPPEQRRAEPTSARADQYAFAATLREALGGRGEGTDVPRRRAPGWLRRVVARGLAATPERRFASMDAFLAALDDGARRRRGRAAVPFVVAAAALVALAIVATAKPTVRWLAARTQAPAAVPAAFDTPDAAPRPIATFAADARSADDTLPPLAPVEASVTTPTTAAGVAHAPSAHAPARRRFADDATTLARMPAGSATAAATTTAAAFASPARASDCDDATPLACTSAAPSCPAGTVTALRDGCWTCADARTCAPLGLPMACDDGSSLVCGSDQPTCRGLEQPVVYQGCWRCMNPFTCAPPRPPSAPAPAPSSRTPGSKPPPDQPAGCGNGTCEPPAEDHTSCALDCCETDATGACPPICGDGFCEPGEDHASCAVDCCELTAAGMCPPTCGNGFCEPGEDHASCAVDCCETDASGQCVDGGSM